MIRRILNLFYPPKCVLCRKVLSKEQTDLCPGCREYAPLFPESKLKLSFLAHWTGLWYYKDDVRSSLLRFKFGGQRGYAKSYGRLLAMKLHRMGWDDTDILTYVPISRRRKFVRGYDQTRLVAQVVVEELNLPLTVAVMKIRHTKPQATLGSAAHRRANILGAYRVTDPVAVKGKRILLLDDIVTTGATAGECARVLMTAGAKEVNLATVAVADHKR